MDGYRIADKSKQRGWVWRFTCDQYEIQMLRISSVTFGSDRTFTQRLT